MQSREHQYIFEPVCASVLLRRNTSKEPLRSRHTPRIEGQVQLEPMSLRLSQVHKTPVFYFVLVTFDQSLQKMGEGGVGTKLKRVCLSSPVE